MKESSFKDGWDVDHGVTYIPYGRLPDSHVLEQLYDGGMVDEDTVPEFLKGEMKSGCTCLRIALNQGLISSIHVAVVFFLCSSVFLCVAITQRKAFLQKQLRESEFQFRNSVDTLL